jgi:hypothetical protein
LGFVLLGFVARAHAQVPAFTFKPLMNVAGLDGQQSTTPPPGQTPGQKDTGVQKILTAPSYFFPDLAHNRAPLTSKGKLKLALVNSVSPGTIFGSAFGAGIGQATNTPGGYGQGAEGYFKRFGAGMATNASNNLIGTYLLASIAHHDPRYFVMGDGNFKQSVRYGLRRVLITRTDDGRPAFNWDGLASPLLAEALANTYQPDAERTVGRTFQRYGEDVAITAGLNILKEFWPTITRKVLVPIGMGH